MNADPDRDPAPLHSGGIYEQWSIGPLGLHFEPLGLHCERPRPSTALHGYILTFWDSKTFWSGSSFSLRIQLPKIKHIHAAEQRPVMLFSGDSCDGEQHGAGSQQHGGEQQHLPAGSRTQHRGHWRTLQLEWTATGGFNALGIELRTVIARHPWWGGEGVEGRGIRKILSLYWPYTGILERHLLQIAMIHGVDDWP